MQTVEQALQKLSRSKFRSGFHLGEREREYLLEKGFPTVREHAAEFVAQRLAPAHPQKDGSQTPTKGHPVFIAQHACACCCRSCLYKWYKVPKGTPLNEAQQEKIVTLLMAWIKKEMEGYQQ